jgi:AI-2 transport protein TqsA
MLLGASLVLIIAGLKSATSIIVPILIAVFIAVISLPLQNWLIAHKVPRGLGTGICRQSG